MSKNIVICCDGTGNEFGAELAKRPDGTRVFENNNSNVLRLYTCLQVDKDQVAYYHPGVGTMGDPSRKWKIERWWSKVKGMAFGLGFTDNMADAYRFLMDNYATGDRIYLFGFSRGAYTVRALAGALNLYGLLCSGNEGHLSYLLRMYSAASQEAFKADHTAPRRLPGTDQSRVFRETFSREVSIHFMGVWDTVSSVGWIWDPVKLLHDGQNPIVRKARHAISVSERRCFFQAMPWGRPLSLRDSKLHADDRQKLEKTLANDGWTQQDIVQAWFPGVHSDVGGSYALSQSGPAMAAFEWMLEEAREKPVNGPAQGLPHDSAADQPLPDGLKIEKQKELAVKGKPSIWGGIRHWNHPQPAHYTRLHQSLCGPWWLLEAFPHKYFDYKGQMHWQFEPWPHSREIPDHALMHPYLREFLADPGLAYKPTNLDPAKISDFTEKDAGDFHPEARQRLIQQGFGVYRTAQKTAKAVPAVAQAAALAATCLCIGAAVFALGRAHR